MDFTQYQQVVATFKGHFPDKGSAMAVWTLGLAGESGEVADIIKKHLGHGHPLNEQEIAKELGDVLWYIAALADELDIDLGAIADANVVKLNRRYPSGFSHQASLNRAD